MKLFPALDVRFPPLVAPTSSDLLLVLLDDFGPTAVEDRDDGLRVFFAAADVRDAALCAVGHRFDASAVDVSDEDWAVRSQASLGPVMVGRLVVAPPWATATAGVSASLTRVVILPSMGFGTGHHATTRLCLAALQTIDLRGKTVLDVGTGSGVLAIAAAALGASRVVGIDRDPDAIHSARENLLLNPFASDVQLCEAELTEDRREPADVVAANLTGGVLVRLAARLLASTSPCGVLILSGIQRAERDAVRRAYRAGSIAAESGEDEWIALVVKKS